MSLPPTAVSEDMSLYVDGIGSISQYDSWIALLWEKGVPYFLRDYRYSQIQELTDGGYPHMGAKERKRRIEQHVRQWNTLNSEIIARELQNGFVGGSG